MLKTVCLLAILLLTLEGFAQRNYHSSSVLASGNWYKIATDAPGIYKVDLALLKALGVSLTSFPSTSIRLYGNGGQMLPEDCRSALIDDLDENAIEVVDGGDGVFSGSDYFLFYSGGPHRWIKDSANRLFSHARNNYADRSFYFISFGGTGKRVAPVGNVTAPGKVVTSYNERYFHELDSLNFLTSGKDWFGEEFVNSPGKGLTHRFTIPLNALLNAEPAVLVSKCIARSVNTSSRFAVSSNNSTILRHEIPSTGNGNLDVFARSSVVTAQFSSLAEPSLTYTYEPGGTGAQGWLDWFEVFARRNLSMAGTNQLLFRDWNSVETGKAGEFRVSGAGATTRVWDITNEGSPAIMAGNFSGSAFTFVNDCSILHEYIAFNNTGFLTPLAVGKIENQDLHAVQKADLIIVTHSLLTGAANRLAAHHLQQDKLTTEIVTTSQVFNEFASGSPDPTAIRNFVRMRYEQAGSDTGSRPKYLLLLGDASYDYKNRLPNNTSMVPAYESSESLDPLSSYTSDDYFGFLEDHEDINLHSQVNTLDIGIGRIPAKTLAEANNYVDKVTSYTLPQSMGEWRNQLTFIADDEDFNLHLQDAEIVTTAAAGANAVFKHNKLYLDAFRQESGSSGSRYPELNREIKNQVNKGTLIWNYSGHGSFRRLAEEVVLDVDVLKSWDNPNRLPLFITATCDFAPYDNPSVTSLGENILLTEKTGAIALMTTTRLVFAFSNRVMNRNYLSTALTRKADGAYQSLGEAVRNAKNITYQQQGDVINNRKFTLLGDPALTLGFPKLNVTTNTINGIPVSLFTDTLKALRQYSIAGSVTDNTGSPLSGFNGTIYATVYDKVQTKTTLGNDPGSLKADFEVQENILFKGKATVVNGNFTFGFKVPVDINYQAGKGKISYYAENGLVDANGSFTGFVVGGSAGTSPDKQGPDIKAFYNAENFSNGTITTVNPQFLLQFSDTSGINIAGTGIGHDIEIIVDNDPLKRYILNAFFESEANQFSRGNVYYRLPLLEEGSHQVRIRAWDGANNSGELVITFRVVKNRSFLIKRMINFPNPVNAVTTFRFEHDLERQDIHVLIHVFTSSGLLVKSIERTINTGGNRSCDIEWDGKNDHGARLKSAAYFYSVRVKREDGTTVQKTGKLVMK